MATTDIVILLFLIVLAANGAYHGFARALINPVTLLLSLALSWVWYTQTRQFNTACLISMLMPFGLSWLAGRWIRSQTPAGSLADLPMLSRLCGMAVELIWGGTIAALVVGFMAVFPFKQFELENWSKDVQRSQALASIRPTLIQYGILPAAKKPTPCLNDVCKIDEDDKADLSTDKELTELAQDPRILKLLNDPSAMTAIRSQNIARILSDPIINELRSDPQFLIKVMRAYPKIQQKINAHEPAN